MTCLQGQGQLLTREELGKIDPSIGEGEMSAVDIITNYYSRYVKAGVKK